MDKEIDRKVMEEDSCQHEGRLRWRERLDGSDVMSSTSSRPRATTWSRSRSRRRGHHQRGRAGRRPERRRIRSSTWRPAPRLGSRRPRNSSPPRLGTCTRRERGPGSDGSSLCRSSASIGSRRATTRRRSPTSRRCSLGSDPRTHLARGAVPRVRLAAHGMGNAGRRELRPEDAHPVGRSQNGGPGTR